jgi:hypothetical protein
MFASLGRAGHSVQPAVRATGPAEHGHASAYAFN